MNLDGNYNLHHDGNFLSLRDYDYDITIRMMVRRTLWAGEGLVPNKGTESDWLCGRGQGNG